MTRSLEVEFERAGGLERIFLEEKMGGCVLFFVGKTTSFFGGNILGIVSNLGGNCLEKIGVDILGEKMLGKFCLTQIHFRKPQALEKVPDDGDGSGDSQLKGRYRVPSCLGFFWGIATQLTPGRINMGTYKSPFFRKEFKI